MISRPSGVWVAIWMRSSGAAARLFAPGPNMAAAPGPNDVTFAPGPNEATPGPEETIAPGPDEATPGAALAG